MSFPQHPGITLMTVRGVVGSRGRSWACRKEQKMAKMLNLEYTCGNQKKSAGYGHEWLFLGKYLGQNTKWWLKWLLKTWWRDGSTHEQEIMGKNDKKSYSEPIIGKQENQEKWGSDGPMRRSCHGYLCYSTPGYHSTLDAFICPPGHVPYFFYLSFSLILFSLHFRLLYFLPSALFSHHNLIFPVARHWFQHMIFFHFFLLFSFFDWLHDPLHDWGYGEWYPGVL